ncbi:MAG: peroxiredoxin [Proteobacteria bacterium]|nr:peroxiredoxin [Pseudomonadota bacterium]
MIQELGPGDRAPELALAQTGGGIATVADHRGHRLVLFFFPKADTPGCTLEANAFSRLKESFTAAATTILGISADPVERLEKFADRNNLHITLAGDPAHRVLTAYGVWGKKSMYGRTYMGITRTTILIGPDGCILRIWPRVRVEGHAEAVLAASQAP